MLFKPGTPRIALLDAGGAKLKTQYLRRRTAGAG